MEEQPVQTSLGRPDFDRRSDQQSDRRSGRDPELSVILPTFNEAENLPILLERLGRILKSIDYEIIVVDDNSPDGTWSIAEKWAENSTRIRSIRRVDERGLSSAVIAGMQVASGRVFAVMDSDLQHDEHALLDIVRPVLAGEADVALGSREAEGGSYGEWGRWRRFVSWGGKQLARRLLDVPVNDPMSGYFAVSRDRYREVAGDVNPRGFKILLEFLARGARPRVVEVGYQFRDRVHGDTKLTGSVVGAYLLALLDLVLGRVVSATFTAYALVGTFGLLVRLVATVAASAAGMEHATLIGFEASVLSNYWLNNRFTFASETRTGWRFLTGIVPFQIVSLHGLVVQIGLSTVVAQESSIAAPPPLIFAGILIATVGNFVLNRTITWRRPR